MPPALQPPEGRASISPYPQARYDIILYQELTSSKPIQSLNRAQPEASKTGCNGSKTHSSDIGSCEVKGSHDSSIIAIVCIVIVLCVAGFVKWKHSWAITAAEGHIQFGETQDRNHRSGRPKREQQEQSIRRHSHRQRDFSTRTTTDLSGQQLQLRERLDERLARHKSVIAQQRAQEIQASLGTNRLGTPEAAHLRDRERVWEQYQLRSDQDIIAGLEVATPMAHQLPFSTGEDDTSSVIRTQPSLETLPEYALEDPLKIEDQSTTLYTSERQFRRTVYSFCRWQASSVTSAELR
ncbi:MAG: hypothetical protein L6R38_006282 [Xanthoria sp. 2 TBL-2021]|nr:MAG: hypothetical protein L6R38_006282 [Xanthoria sp. 2 TBL-2021]